MLVLALCLMTKLLEYSSGRVLIVEDDPAPKRPRRRRAKRAKAPVDNKQPCCDNNNKKITGLPIVFFF